MSGGRRNNFDGQQWREKVIRTRVNAALADLPPLERRLRYGEEYKRQINLFRQEHAAKIAAKKEAARAAQAATQQTAAEEAAQS